MQFYRLQFCMILLLAIISSSLWAEEISSVALDSLKGVSPLIELDSAEKIEGSSSIKITAETPCRVTIGQFAGLNYENFTLRTNVKVKTRMESGTVLLETLVKVKGGVYFSRAMDQKLSGDTDWKEVFTNFFFKAGESPEEVTVNLIIDGKGVIWADDLKVFRDTSSELSR